MTPMRLISLLGLENEDFVSLNKRVPNDSIQYCILTCAQVIASLIYCTEPEQKKTRCSRRRQTSPPVPPPGELDETYASSVVLVYWLYYVKT